MKSGLISFFIMQACFCSTLLAGEVEVIQVEVTKERQQRYRFHVTLNHEDSGWDHYADKWEVLDEDGEVLGTRILYHPHVNEQPFTRSLSGVRIPPQIKARYRAGPRFGSRVRQSWV